MQATSTKTAGRIDTVASCTTLSDKALLAWLSVFLLYAGAGGCPLTPQSPKFVDQFEDYQKGYAARKSVSPGFEYSAQRVCNRLDQLLANRTSNAGLRFLSVGCGDGSFDIEVLRHISATHAVDYVGVDPNGVSLRCFDQALALTAMEEVSASLLNSCAEDILAQEFDPFDIILFSHSLYYFDEPAEVVQQYFQRFLGEQGSVIIVHAALNGVQEIVQTIEGLSQTPYAEEIRDGLTKRGLSVHLDVFPYEMETTDILLGTDFGMRVLNFCLECDYETLPSATKMRVMKEIWGRSSVRGARTFMPEAMAIIEIPARTDDQDQR